jgi:hypothetical protein
MKSTEGWGQYVGVDGLGMHRLCRLGSASPIDDGDESRTYRHHHFWVFWTPIWVKGRGCCLVELNGKDLREFFNTKRANGHRKTSEESLCIFSFLFIEPLQCTTVCFVPCLQQVVQDFPNTRRKCAT